MRCLFLILLLAAVPGCLVTSSSNETRTGTYVSDEALAQIQPGKTTTHDVRQALGEPNEKSQSNGDDIWKYTYTITKNSAGTVFLLLASSDSHVSVENVTIEFKEGVVTKISNTKSGS